MTWSMWPGRGPWKGISTFLLLVDGDPFITRNSSLFRSSIYHKIGIKSTKIAHICPTIAHLLRRLWANLQRNLAIGDANTSGQKKRGRMRPPISGGLSVHDLSYRIDLPIIADGFATPQPPRRSRRSRPNLFLNSVRKAALS